MIFSHMLTSCDIYSLYPWFTEVNFTFELVDCAVNEDFVKSRFCSIHSTVILAGLKKSFVILIPEDFVL